MTDGEALAKEREVVNSLTDGMETLLCRLVAVRVILADLLRGEVVNRIESQLVERLAPEVRAKLDDQFAIIRGHPHVTTPPVDWLELVESLVETGKGFDLSPPNEEQN